MCPDFCRGWHSDELESQDPDIMAELAALEAEVRSCAFSPNRICLKFAS